jgi:hypothetical protein
MGLNICYLGFKVQCFKLGLGKTIYLSLILVEAKNLYCECWFARAGLQETLLVAPSLRLF